MRRSLVTLGLAAIALSVSCSGDGSSFAPADATRLSAAAAATACPALTTAQYNAIITQLGKLYPTNSKTYSGLVGKANDIKSKLSQGKTADAQQKAFDILKVVLADRTAGNLKPTATAADVQQLLNLLYAATCLGTAPTLPTGSGTGSGVIPPSGGKVLTSDLKAGVVFPAGAVTQNTIVTIAPTATTLNTPLDQYAPTYEFTATPHDPATPFGATLTVGVCLNPADDVVVDRLRLAHNIADAYVTPNRFGKIEIMPLTSTTGIGLSCPSLLGSASTLDAFKSYAASLLLPGPLHASSAAAKTGGLGGTTRTLSPFAAVDPQISLTINGGNGQTATAGTAVATPPSVKAQTLLGTNVPGVPIKFTVTSGGGSILPATNVLTDASGVASAASWTLGSTPGSNTATGSGQPISLLTYTPASVTFTATGVAAASPIDYGAAGYRYKQSPFGADTAGFTTTGYSDGGWSVGDAAFGSNNNLSCTLNSNGSIETAWAPSTQLLVRRSFTVAGGATSARVSVAIDNDIKVYINGSDVTSLAKINGGATAPTFVNGFAVHDDCPTQGSLTFDVTGLNPGNNLLVIHAIDRGTSSYLDVKVEAH